MPVRHVVWGQQVSETKKFKARELRREMTRAERALWQHLRGRQIQGLRFRRQQVIHGYIADFYCHPASLIIEVDGSVHEHQVQYDNDRQMILELNEFRVLRFTNDQVLDDIETVLTQIHEAITDHRN